ncbi:MAG: VOC family protein, partial [Actinobacteria bacterium]|nr:VOC family protein [Actinomycetota bacterium]
MGISHIALAVKDLEATHRFYTDVMGFDLVKVEIA